MSEKIIAAIWASLTLVIIICTTIILVILALLFWLKFGIAGTIVLGGIIIGAMLWFSFYKGFGG